MLALLKQYIRDMQKRGMHRQSSTGCPHQIRLPRVRELVMIQDKVHVTKGVDHGVPEHQSLLSARVHS
jgi:hypothetical protein